MKLEIAQKPLANLLTNVYKAISNRPTQPIMACFLLQADMEKQVISVTSSNGSLGILAQCSCKVITGGTLAINADLFTDVIFSLHNLLHLEIVNNQLVVTHATGKCRLAISSFEEFIALPIALGKSITLPVEVFNKAICATAPFAARNEIKQVLAAIHLKLSLTSWEAAATDGHRLGIACSGNTETVEEFTDAVTIPYATITCLKDILSSCKGDCQVTINDNIISFQLTDVLVTSRLLNDSYPNYRSLLPKQFNYRFIVDKNSFLSALNRVATCAERKDKFVQITFGQESCTLYAEAQDIGGALESVEISSEELSNNFTIGFNIKYLAEAVKAIASKEVIIKASAPTHPVILAPMENLDQFVLIMPVQLKQIKEFTVSATTPGEIAA